MSLYWAIGLFVTCLLLGGALAYLWGVLYAPRKRWFRAISPSSSVMLGRCTFDEALARAMALGKVSYYDPDHGIFFFDTHFGGELPKDSDVGRIH